MRYREALNIGKRAEGTIMCTFATIYDANGKGLFSMQRVQQINVVNWKGGYSDDNSWSDALIVPTGDNVYFTDGGYHGDVNANTDGELKGGITFDLPFVTIDQISSDRLVPATLTETAIEVITKACENVKVTKYIIERVWDAQKPTNTPGGSPAVGSRTIVKETYYLSPSEKREWLQERTTQYYHYEIRTEVVISPKYIALSEILETRGTVYIKPDAFNWHPLDVENATVTETDENGNTVEINLIDKLKAAEQQLNVAKAALIAAGAASFAG